MRKMKICSAGNEGNFSYVIVEKNKDFFEWLSRLLFSTFKMYDVDKDEFVNKKSEWVSRKKRIEKFVDAHETYPTQDARIDIFYGKKKTFITINASPANRKKFMDALNEFSVWRKPKKPIKE